MKNLSNTLKAIEDVLTDTDFKFVGSLGSPRFSASSDIDIAIRESEVRRIVKRFREKYGAKVLQTTDYGVPNSFNFSEYKCIINGLRHIHIIGSYGLDFNRELGLAA